LAARSAWLADSIDFTHSPEGVVLTFKRANDQRAILTLPAAALRQWLNIVYDAYARAEWSLAAWPEWVSEAATPGQAALAVDTRP